MPKKRFLICGATGFIGRNIAETLARRDDLEIVGVFNRRPAYEHPRIAWRRADLTRPEDVEHAVEGIDVIVQAAATTSGSKDIVTRPYIHVTDNAVMNSLLFRAAHDCGVGHVVFFSCSVMYPTSERPLSETDFDANRELHPRYFGVGWTKLYIEKMCEFYSRLGRTRYTAIRHSNVYGPHDKFDLEHSHVFGATVTKVMSATDGRVVVWGTGEEARDLVYIDDLVDFLERVLERQKTPFELFTCGGGSAITVKELVARIVAASGRNLRIEHDLAQPTIPTTLWLDCAKARRELEWEPRIGLEQGIRKTIDWWRGAFADAPPVAATIGR